MTARVACIGNMNNNFFSLVRYLRDRGIDAILLLLDTELDHFMPSADTFDSDFESYTRTLQWGAPYDYLRVSPEVIARDTEGFDFLVVCGSVPAYLEKIGRAVDVFAPYGSDFLFYPFFKIVRPRNQFAYWKFSRAQRRGIRNAHYINIDLTNADTEAVFDRIGSSAERLNFGLPMLYSPLYNPTAIRRCYPRSSWYPYFQKIRNEHDVVVFHQARHSWKNPPDPFSAKDNDKLFRGFAEFVRAHRNVRPALVTCEYGVDVAETKRLVAELGIEANVFWFPRLPRKELMVGLSLADIGSGEFHKSWISCGTVYETLAMAKPLLHYREDALYAATYPELYPMLNVRQPQDVVDALSDFVRAPERFRAMGEAGRQWFQKFAVDYPVREYERIIRERTGARQQAAS